MTTVEQIEKAIEKLAPGEIDRLRAWFEEFQAERFDDKIARDGKLDGLADEAVADFGRSRGRSI